MKLWNKTSAASKSTFELLENKSRKGAHSVNLKNSPDMSTSAHIVLTCPGDTEMSLGMVYLRAHQKITSKHKEFRQHVI